MTQNEFEIPMASGSAEAVIYRPEGEGPWPGVLYFTDIGGIRPSNREMAKRVAAQGYTVLLPNIFYRTGNLPLNYPSGGPPDVARKRFAELARPLTPEAIDQDAQRYLGYLEGRVAIIGFCVSGPIALRVAASYPDRVAAVASFHGGGLWTDTPASPHLWLPKVTARLYFGHATNDHGMPAESIQQFDRALADWGGRYESEVYEGASHGWTVPNSPAYNEPQAERAFGKLADLLAGALPSPNR